jgi:PKD repeat protein
LEKELNMKTHQIILILILPVLVLAAGCTKYELGNPDASTVAGFTFTATNSSKAPCDVAFTNTSLNAVGYHWDFGNGQTSTEANPTAHYDTAGFYTVTLTCTPINEVYYNQLVKTMVVNVKDPNAGLSQVLYFTTRTPEGGGVHMVILNEEAPVVQDFTAAEFSRPYGVAVDTANRKVYVTDYSLGYIYRFNADGTNPEKILDASVAGQEITGSPEAIFVHGDKIYWGSPGGIFRANLDGSNPEPYISTGTSAPEYPIDMQFDPATGTIYMVNDKTDYTGGYFTLNFDGSAINELIEDVDGTAIEVDLVNGKVYFALYASDTPPIEGGIYVSNLDGTGLTKIGDYGTKATWGVAIDQKRGKLFWSYKISNSNPDGKIIRSNLDGTGVEDWITGVNPQAMTVAWIKL